LREKFSRGDGYQQGKVASEKKGSGPVFFYRYQGIANTIVQLFRFRASGVIAE
jgi:hypothetical protein